jgi:hypothetical protein
MTSWLERARAKISESPSQDTVNTVVRNPTTATVVCQPGEFEKTESGNRSNDCNDSTVTSHPPESETSPGTTKIAKTPDQVTVTTTVRDGLEPGMALWQAEIEALPPSAEHDIDRLRTVSLEFLQSGHAAEAVRQGWTEIDLFGVFGGDLHTAKGRLDARGLVPLLAWAPWQPLKLKHIGPGFVTVITPFGSVLRQRRERPAKTLAIAWWRNSAMLETSQ